MTRALRRYLSLILSFLLLVAASPVVAMSEETPVATEPIAEAVETQAAEPTIAPTAESTPAPTAEPTGEPSAEPAAEPSAELTEEPANESTGEPSAEPTGEPSVAPTNGPTEEASAEPTESVTAAPTSEIAPEPSPIAILSVLLDTSELTLYIGETRVLAALVEPADAASSLIIWTSSDEAVATVDSNGVVVAVSPGTAIISAAAQGESGVTAECAVTVPQPITSLAVVGQARIQVGKSYPLAALDGEAAIAEGALDWASSDEAIATVDGAGVVTGVSIGNAVITATARDGSGLAFDFPVEILRATVLIRTKSNKQFSRVVCENNADAEKNIAPMSRMAKTARAGSAEFQLMRLVLKTDGTDPAIDEFNPDVIIANRDNRYLIQFTTAEETEAAYELLSKADYVKYVESDSLMSISSTQSYSYNSWGAEAMHADEASEYLATATSASLKVAVVDSGVSPHSFIGGKLINGYDYVDDDGNPADENGHGTHVAGTIVDLTQALNVSVVAYRAFDAAGYGYTSNITNAIMVAADDGCKVINLSACGAYTSAGYSMYSNAISYAVSKGATFCCAAGNNASSTSGYVPSCITTPGCIVVASVGNSLSHSSFSNYGSSVDVSAPGEDILSCNYSGGFRSMSGTSMATPHISAACAIIRLAHPGYGPSQVETALKEMCTDLGSAGCDTTYGFGIPDLSAIANPTGVVVSATKTTLAVGGGMQLAATVSPSGTNATVTWSSSNEGVLTVSSSGYVTAVAPGSARITATTVNGLTGYVDLTVPNDEVSGVVVSAPQTTLSIGSGIQLAATISPSTADQTAVWTSSNTNVATVSMNGYVTAVAPGSARITATAVNGLTGHIDLTISYNAATAVVVSAPGSILALGSGMALTATVSPATANQAVTWLSSNESVLTVSASGYATAVSSGTARVTARTSNNLTAYVDVIVGARISDQSIVVGKRQTWQLSVTGNAGAVAWASANPSVATVSSTGLVKGKSVGQTEITATVDGLTLKCAVRVSKPTLSATSARISALTKYKLTVSYTTKPVRWTSSRTSVATVSSSGKITARRPGTATITATVDGYRLKCKVTVKANGHSYSVSMKPGNYESGATIAIGKVYYSGSNIYLDAYLVNNYSNKTIYKINSLKISVYDEETGTLLAKKKFTNIYARLGHGKIKKITLRFYGSATIKKGYELRLRTQTFTIGGSVALK